uniref:Trafficking protein particle complex subunit 2-like protein n=1 Tax=Corethrella appendiculata TaxID=1370023 RepID=U5EV47_9DIPT
MAACISIIAKNNSPLYIATADLDKEIELQYRVNASLDVVEEKCLQKQTPDSRDLYLGLLYATETYKIYGYVTNTKVKFIIIIDSSNTSFRENEVRTMFRNLHNLYSDAVCNPFYIPGEQLTSKNFDKNVRSIINGM